MLNFLLRLFKKPKPIKFYCPTDPHKPCPHYNWDYVYLHGKVEELMYAQAAENRWKRFAYDQFVADTPMPTKKGEYKVYLYGNEVVAVIAKHPIMRRLAGRAALRNDEKALAHCRDPKDWR